MNDIQRTMRSIIQRIATGPELSKDIALEEARLGMQAILDVEVDPVQAGIFLIALRMKRETDDEQRGVLDAVRDATQHVVADVDEVVDIADPYDGYNRCLPASPFLAPVLAECGVPAMSHGVDAVGPKFGVTHRHVLAAAGLPVDLSPTEAAARIADPAIGWSYLDQRAFAPKLHDLVGLRGTIVKRQVITTVEVLARPFTAAKRRIWSPATCTSPIRASMPCSRATQALSPRSWCAASRAAWCRRCASPASASTTST
jgi:anthranilate phosphoribosyltransferase